MHSRASPGCLQIPYVSILLVVMGAYLDKPVLEKVSRDEKFSNFKYGVSLMQGWRIDMEVGGESVARSYLLGRLVGRVFHRMTKVLFLTWTTIRLSLEFLMGTEVGRGCVVDINWFGYCRERCISQYRLLDL